MKNFNEYKTSLPFPDRKNYYDNPAEYKNELQVYNESQAKLNEQFKLDCFNEVGIDINHPGAEDLWWEAYDGAHSGGYEEVYNCFVELADLVKKFM